MSRLDSGLYVVERSACALAFSVMLALVGLEVGYRYIFGATLMVGIQEIAKWSFVWLVAMACPAVLHLKGHVTVDYFMSRFIPARLHKPAYYLTQLALLHFFVIVAATGFPFAVNQWSIRSTSSNIPNTFLYLALPLSMTFMFIHTLAQVWDRFTEDKRP